MHKKTILIFLFCLTIGQHLIADTEEKHIKRLETIYTHYNNGHKIISNNPESDIILLQNHCRELQEEKNELNTFYNKTVKPTLHRIDATILGIAALAVTFYLIMCLEDEYKKNYHSLIWTFKKNPYFFFFNTLDVTATGLLCKYCIKCASYPSKRTKEINAAITRDQIIIAQLQKQIKLKENNA